MPAHSLSIILPQAEQDEDRKADPKDKGDRDEKMDARLSLDDWLLA